MAKAKSVTLTTDIEQKLAKWRSVAEQAKLLKADEFGLRQSIVASAGFDSLKLEGAETLDIGFGGWKLKACKEQNYALTNKQGETVKLLTILGAQRPELATGLVDWKPELKIKAYREVAELAKTGEIPGLAEALAEALTIKPGAPTLELIPPEDPQKVN